MTKWYMRKGGGPFSGTTGAVGVNGNVVRGLGPEGLRPQALSRALADKLIESGAWQEVTPARVQKWYEAPLPEVA